MSILTNSMRLGNATVYSNDILPKGKVVPGRTIKVERVTIHNTGVVNVPANNFHRSQKSQNSSGERQASWHFTVDEKEIWQSVRYNWEAWHCGNSTGNKTSIGIEVTEWSDATRQKQAFENAAALAAKLLKDNGLGLDRLVQHNYWSGKNCPSVLRAGKFGCTWSWFKDLVAKYYNGSSQAPSTPPSGSSANIAVKKTTDDLNLRTQSNANSSIILTIPKSDWVNVKEDLSNGWSKVEYKGKVGYVNRSYLAQVTKVTTANLNMRNKPNTSGTILLTIPKGKRVDIIETGSWNKVRYSGKVGYCSADYLKI